MSLRIHAINVKPGNFLP